ncbi:MAG: hypothetical protein AABX93_00125 [Nanoarchaeota archaeon]
MEKNLYLTPDELGEGVLSVRDESHYVVNKDGIGKVLDKFLDELPKKDRVDEYIHSLFSTIFLDREQCFMSMRMGLDTGEPCTYVIENFGDYSTDIENEAIERLRLSGWNRKNYPYGKIESTSENGTRLTINSDIATRIQATKEDSWYETYDTDGKIRKVHEKRGEF